MSVVADTSPLNYLVQIKCEYLLPQLYRKVLIPSAVFEELSRPGAPLSVRTWLVSQPPWLEVNLVESYTGTSLDYLDAGEREAIQLAEQRHASLLLIDERKGQAEAKRRGLQTTGTLGIFVSAGRLRLIDPEQIYRRLIEETNFRTSSALEKNFLDLIRSPF